MQKLVRFMPIWFFAVGLTLAQVGIAYCNESVFSDEKLKTALSIGILVVILTGLGIALLTQFTTANFAKKAVIVEAICVGLGGITFGTHLWHMSEKDSVRQVQNLNDKTLKNNQDFTLAALDKATNFQKAQTGAANAEKQLIKEAGKNGIKIKPTDSKPKTLDVQDIIKSGQGQIVDTTDFNEAETAKKFLSFIRLFNILDILAALLGSAYLMFCLKGNMDLNQNNIPDNEESETEENP